MSRTRHVREAARVLKPGGQILIMNLKLDGWIRVALPTLPGHGYFGREQDTTRWRTALTEAGFDVVEQGTRPGTKYSLGRKNGASARHSWDLTVDGGPTSGSARLRSVDSG